jgi:hypothetical protein
MHLEIGVLKALLRELGFNFNGKSCSMMSLFNKCQEFVYGNEQRDVLATVQERQTPKKETVTQKQLQVEDLLQKIKDVFYTSKKTIYDLFQEGKAGTTIDVIGLTKIVTKYSGGVVSEEQIDQVFRHVAKGAESLAYQDFDRIFQWPKVSGVEWETRCFRAIREWMFKSNLSSETVFELMLQKANKVI